mmetsp:Transcript_19835/g.42668  ORF Transcript_19835/g.42668 Transcript_19835/m.42668 type:complete len:98 (+) Transcript_19835:20-313(+)
MANKARAPGTNFILAAVLATLSYLPFELVAKGTLIVCVTLFVADPFPTSRLVSVGGVAMVLLLTRARRNFTHDEEQLNNQSSSFIVSGSNAAREKAE